MLESGALDGVIVTLTFIYTDYRGLELSFLDHFGAVIPWARSSTLVLHQGDLPGSLRRLTREGDPCPARSLGSLNAASYLFSEHLELIDSVYLLDREGIEGERKRLSPEVTQSPGLWLLSPGLSLLCISGFMSFIVEHPLSFFALPSGTPLGPQAY